MHTDGSHLRGDRGANALDQVRIECCTQANALWKHRAVGAVESVQPFLDQQHWNSKPGAGTEPTLQIIGNLGPCWIEVVNHSAA